MTGRREGAGPITACLLHADFHVMAPECWGSVLDWQSAHEGIPEAQRRDAYQAAVERRMLDALRAPGSLS